MTSFLDFLNRINQVIGEIDNFLWGWVMAFLLLAAGIYFTVKLNFPQIHHAKEIFGTLNVFKKDPNEVNKEKGAISGFAALCATVGGQVGTGSLVGVASALAAGGPGALFWMWMTALVGMATSFVETVLGQIFHEKGVDGTYYGGAHYYMRKGLNSKFRPVAYAVTTIVTIGFALTMIQNNSISAAVVNVIDVPVIVPGVIVTILAAIIAFGGAKRITDISTLIVPFMAVGYIIVTLIIVITHISLLPEMFKMVFTYAFSTKAAAGGIAGYTVRQAFRQGIARGLFSNDAGNGCHSSMHATAQVNHPAKQGFAAMFGTFLTTIIICSCTGFAILLTGVLATDAEGINLVQMAFASTIGTTGRWIAMFAMALFGFTTLTANIFYGEVSVRYLFKKDIEKKVVVYKVIALLLVLLGAIMPLASLWNLVDLCTAFLILINVPSIVQLGKHVKYVLVDYEKQVESGKMEPTWDNNKDFTNGKETI